MFGIGPMELVVILAIALVVFGPKKIPEIANALGRSINEFKKGTAQIEASVRQGLTEGEAHGTAVPVPPAQAAAQPPQADASQPRT